MSSPLRPPNKSKQTLKLVKAVFTSQIPNMYTNGTFNNVTLKVTKTGGVGWSTIVLPNGLRTLDYLTADINSSCSGWWASDSDPGFHIRYNLSTNIVYISMDSSKLGLPGQLGIDVSTSSISELLGYNDPANQVFITDGSHAADSPAVFDWFGYNVSVLVEGFGPLSYKNGTPSYEIATVPLTAASVGNEYIYPVAGLTSPEITLHPGLQDLQSFTIKFKGSRLNSDGSQMQLLALEGEAQVVLELSWYA